MKALKIVEQLLRDIKVDREIAERYSPPDMPPLEEFDKRIKFYSEAISELERLQNAKCENCKHSDIKRDSIIHCSYFEEFMPLEIGKCDKWEAKQ